jgi:hypothetical protein
MGENIIGINGKDYLIVNRKPETGDLIFCNDMIGEFRYTDGGYNIVNYGGSVDGKDAWYVDDCQVLVPLKTVGITQASRDIHDLLANLARRVSSLEQQLSDTQGNVEKLAEELANVTHWNKKHATMFGKLYEDVRLLKDCAHPKEVEVVTFEKFLDSVADDVAKKLAEKVTNDLRTEMRLIALRGF